MFKKINYVNSYYDLIYYGVLMYMYKSLFLIFLCKKKRFVLIMYVFIKKIFIFLFFNFRGLLLGIFFFLFFVKIEGGEGGGKFKFEM